MERLRRADALLQGAEKVLLVGILSVMIVLSFSQVVLRQAFGAGILWADTLLRHLVLWVGFLGAALAAADNKHFAWEAAAHAEGSRGDALRLVSRLAAAVIGAALVRASSLFFHEEYSAGTALFTAGGVNVPAWLFVLIIPAGFALVVLHTLVQAAESAAALRARKRA